jgi:hypothetical protein
MAFSRSPIYASSENAAASKWMPWELGYFPGRSGAKIGLVRNFGYSPAGAFTQITFGLCLEPPCYSAEQELLIGGSGVLAKDFAVFCAQRTDFHLA